MYILTKTTNKKNVSMFVQKEAFWLLDALTLGMKTEIRECIKAKELTIWCVHVQVSNMCANFCQNKHLCAPYKRNMGAPT